MPQRDQASPRRFEALRRKPPTPEPAPAAEVPRLIRYVTDGVTERAPAGASVADGLRFADGGRDRLARFFYPAPTRAGIVELADAWQLHPVLVEDLQNAHQRPKLERYGNAVFLVARSARYIDDIEEVAFEEFHILIGPHAVAVLCQDKRWIDGTDGTRFDEDRADTPDRRERTLLADEALLRLGPEAVAYRLLDAIVDGYSPVVRGLTIDKEQIERQVFSGDTKVAERIYRLSQEVIDLQHATSSLSGVLDALRRGFEKYGIADELQVYLQDVSDHLTVINSQVAEIRDALAQILSVNATLVSQRQNEDMKKISGWAAILFAPTLIAAIYGMNFVHMPELEWSLGYPFAILLMVAFAAGLYLIFKLRKWM